MKCEHCPVQSGRSCLGEIHRPVCLDVQSGLPGRAEQLVALAEPKPPGILEMAGSFVRATVAHVADGCREAPPEVQAERKRICLTNACGSCVNEGRGCNACGCGVSEALSFVGLDMDEKRRWASSRCPLPEPLWGPV
jgi:hypothetical protein